MTIETTPYEIELSEGPFEVRSYGNRIVAEAILTGKRDHAASAGFRRLAGYIFGGNSRSMNIAMTSPVLQFKASEPVASGPEGGTGERWAIRFVLPRDSTLPTLPTPTDSNVRLLPLEPSRVVVVRFSGLTGETRTAEKLAELDAFVASRELGPTGPAILARYDPPWTLWFSRRNELMREIVETSVRP
jgi:hypothetical protein